MSPTPSTSRARSRYRAWPRVRGVRGAWTSGDSWSPWLPHRMELKKPEKASSWGKGGESIPSRAAFVNHGSQVPGSLCTSACVRPRETGSTLANRPVGLFSRSGFCSERRLANEPRTLSLTTNLTGENPAVLRPRPACALSGSAKSLVDASLLDISPIDRCLEALSKTRYSWGREN